MAEYINKQELALAASTALFQGVDEMVVERILSDEQCSRRSYRKGERIFDETHFSKSLGIVLSGKLQIEHASGENRNVQMSQLTAGDCFGAAAMFQEVESYPTQITAQANSSVLFLPQSVLLWYMQRNPTIMENYIRFLTQRIRFLNNKIAILTAGSAEQKLLLYLREYGSFSGPMTELGKILNVSRATLYRALETLAKKHIVRRGDKTVAYLGEKIAEIT